MFGNTTYNEQLIMGDMIQTIIQSNKNEEITKVYNLFKSKYDFIKKYSFLVGTNDESGSSFHTNVLSELNSKTFYDFDDKEITVEHHFSDYKNVLYLTNKLKKDVSYDSSVFIDSNSMNIFERFYKKEISNDFIKFKFKHNIDLNYLPYVLEDYVNPHHERPNPERTLEKIKIFETVNNLDIIYYKESNGRLRVNKKLLNEHGFENIDDLIEDRIFYFNHFIDKLQHQYRKVQLNSSPYFYYKSNNKFDIYSLLSDYYLIYGYILKILIEKRKNNSTEEKIKNIFHEMVYNGRNLKHILEFSYDYFENENLVNEFFNYDNSWGFEKILSETRNKTWDIFLYSMTQHFITDPRHRFKRQNVDFGVSFFLTKDNRFYKSYVNGYMKKFFIINESIKGRPFSTMNERTERSQKVENIIYDYYDNNNDELMKIKLKKSQLNQKYLYPMSVIFKEQMERELKNIL